MRDREWVAPSPRTCTQNGRALELSGEDLKCNFDYVKSVVELNGKALAFASYMLRNNRDIVSAAARQDSSALRFATEDVLKDPDFMMSMVNIDYRTLKYADPDLHDDEDFMLQALEASGASVRFFSERLRSNKEVMRRAVDMCAHNKMLAECGEVLKADREFVLDVVTVNGLALQHAAKELKRDAEIVHAAVTNNGLALAYASPICRRNREVVLRAVAQNGGALVYASDELQRDRAILLLATRGDAACRIAALMNEKARCVTAPGEKRVRADPAQSNHLRKPGRRSASSVRQRDSTRPSITSEASGDLWAAPRKTAGKPALMRSGSGVSDRTSVRTSNEDRRGTLLSVEDLPAVRSKAPGGRPTTVVESRGVQESTGVGRASYAQLRSSYSLDDDSASEMDVGSMMMSSKVASNANDASGALSRVLQTPSMRPSQMDGTLSAALVLDQQQAEEQSNLRRGEYNNRVNAARAAQVEASHTLKAGPTDDLFVQRMVSKEAAPPVGYEKTILRPLKKTRTTEADLRKTWNWQEDGAISASVEAFGGSIDGGAELSRKLSLDDENLSKWAGDPMWKPKAIPARQKTMDDLAIQKSKSSPVIATKSQGTKFQSENLIDFLDRERSGHDEKVKSVRTDPSPKTDAFKARMRFGQNLSLPNHIRSSLGGVFKNRKSHPSEMT